MKGAQLKYEMSYSDEEGLIVKYAKTGEEYHAQLYTTKGGQQAARIIHDDQSDRRMTWDMIDAYIINCTTTNVESTIHQVFHRLERRNKIRYRGIARCHRYVLSRAMWVNFKRILAHRDQNIEKMIHFIFSAITNRYKFNLIFSNACFWYTPWGITAIKHLKYCH